MATYIKKDFASPNGPILLLSAKGSTTASIAEANGVKDFSGNGNHGTASGGIGVTNDSEMGSCFDFTDLSAVQSINGAFQNPSNSVTVSIRYKRTGSIENRNQLLIGDANSSNVCRLSIYITTRTDPNLVQVAIYTNNEVILSCNINTEYGMVTSDPHLYTSTYDASTSSLCLYVDDKLVASTTVAVQSFTVSKFMLGYPTSSFRPVGLVSEARIYPRALSAAEVKYLCNGFQPNIIVGQAIPSGAILDLSARGLTTAGIAQANGVVDRSGNGNHGQAYNGVAVVNDDEIGSCFSFDGSNDVIAIGSNNLSSYFNDMEEMSLSLLLRVNAVNTGSQYLVSFKTQVSASNQSWICLWIDASTRRISFSGRWKESDWGNPWTGNEYFLTADLGTVYHTTVVCDFKNGVFKAYVNGVLVQTTDNLRTGNLRALSDGNNVFFGALNDTPQYGLNCSLANIRIYPRALTASEVQQLADASLKKITNIKSGSSDVRQIFSNGEMIYAKTNDYSLNL